MYIILNNNELNGDNELNGFSFLCQNYDSSMNNEAKRINKRMNTYW